MNILQKALSNFVPQKKSFNWSGVLSWLDHSSRLKISDPYNEYIGWVYRCTAFRADSFASIFPKLYRRVRLRNGKHEEVEVFEEESQLLRDLLYFNPASTLFQELQRIETQRCLAGKAYLYIAPKIDGTGGNNFFVLPASRFKIKTKRNGLPESYLYYDDENNEKTIKAENLVSLGFIHPTSINSSWSPLEAGSISHKTWEKTNIYNFNLIENGGKPQGILSVRGASTPDLRQQLELLYRSKYTGTENAGNIVLAEDGEIDFIDLMKNASELQYLDSKKDLKEDIHGFFGVPVPLTSGQSSYMNTKESQRIFQKFTLEPILLSTQAILNHDFIPKYKQLYIGNDNMEGLFFRYENYITQEKTEDSKYWSTLYNSGIVKRSEARANLKLPVNDTEDNIFKVENINNDNNTIDEKTTNNTIETKSMSSSNDELGIRDIARNMFFAKTIEVEDEFRGHFAKYFAEQFKRFELQLQNYKKPNINIDLDITIENEIGYKQLRPIYQDISTKFVEFANQLLVPFIPYTTDLTNDLNILVLEYFNYINETTRKSIRETVVTAIHEKLLYSEMVSKLNDIYIDIQSNRVNNCVTLEVGKVKSLTMRAIYDIDSRTCGYEWVTTKDGRQRPAHDIADGQRISKGEKYFVGGEFLKYPCDQHGSLHNTSGCRCFEIPIFSKLEDE